MAHVINMHNSVCVQNIREREKKERRKKERKKYLLTSSRDQHGPETNDTNLDVYPIIKIRIRIRIISFSLKS